MTKLIEISTAAHFAYDALSEYFHTHADEVVEITVIHSYMAPTGDQIYLEDKEKVAIGVTKKVLAGAFVEAVQRFSQTRRQTQHLELDNEALNQTLLKASRVILIFDPEHISAANFRREYVLQAQKNSDVSHCDRTNEVTEKSFETTVRREFFFLNSILTSPLHRQTKSPTLWEYRRWLYSLCLQHRDSLGVSFFESLLHITAIRSELLIVMKAGEIHRMNYYAWQYARRLFGLFFRRRKESADLESPALVGSSVPLVLNWCLNHPGDTSGYSFLLWLIDSDDCSKEVANTTVSAVLNDATCFHQEQESVMWFLKMAETCISTLTEAVRNDTSMYIETVKTQQLRSKNDG